MSDDRVASAAAGHLPGVGKSPESDVDVSPSTRREANGHDGESHGGADYFSARPGDSVSRGRDDRNAPRSPDSDTSTVVSPATVKGPGARQDKARASGASAGDGDGVEADLRKSSAASVSFRPPADPGLPQGRRKSSRIKSPTPER